MIRVTGAMNERAYRILVSVSFAALCLTIVAPAILKHIGLGSFTPWLYFFFSSVCHQSSERSFFLIGSPLAVCQRCSGIYLGLFLGSLPILKWRDLGGDLKRRRMCVLGASLPLILDAGLPFLHIWRNSAASRFTTGLIFGVMLSGLLVVAIADFMREGSWRKAQAANAGGAL